MTSQRWINLAAFVVMVAVNALANIIPLGGYTSGGVSKLYPSFFTPAGITFAIWGVIYLMLGVVVVWSMFDRSVATTELVNKVGMLFAVSCAFNIAWIFCWHYRQIFLSNILIVALMITLFVIMFRVRHNMLASMAIGTYAGWITVATIAAMYVTASSLGWNALSNSGVVITAIGLILGALIISAVVYMTGNNMFALAAIWGYAGIIIEHVTTYKGMHPFLIIMAAAGILLIGGVSVYSMIINGSISLVNTGRVMMK